MRKSPIPLLIGLKVNEKEKKKSRPTNGWAKIRRLTIFTARVQPADGLGMQPADDKGLPEYDLGF